MLGRQVVVLSMHCHASSRDLILQQWSVYLNAETGIAATVWINNGRFGRSCLRGAMRWNFDPSYDLTLSRSCCSTSEMGGCWARILPICFLMLLHLERMSSTLGGSAGISTFERNPSMTFAYSGSCAN